MLQKSLAISRSYLFNHRLLKMTLKRLLSPASIFLSSIRAFFRFLSLSLPLSGLNIAPYLLSQLATLADAFLPLGFRFLSGLSRFKPPVMLLGPMMMYVYSAIYTPTAEDLCWVAKLLLKSLGAFRKYVQVLWKENRKPSVRLVLLNLYRSSPLPARCLRASLNTVILYIL